MSTVSLTVAQSTRRLEQEAGGRVEPMCLPGRLAANSETISGFRNDNTEAVRLACKAIADFCKDNTDVQIFYLAQ